MIDQATRDKLRQQVRKGDYESAAKIYQKIVNRYVTPRYLEKFLKGQKNPSGRPGCHDPLKMFEAVAEAVSQRNQRQLDTTEKANRLIAQITRDTTPTQPMPV